MVRISVRINPEWGKRPVRVYDLFRIVSREIQDVEHGGLFGIPLRKDRLGTGSFSLGSCIEGDDLTDVIETLDHTTDAQRNTRFGQLTAHEAQDRQSQNTVKGVNSQFLVSPVVRGPEGDDTGVFHASESALDMELAPVGQDDLFVAPVITVREEEGFAKKRALKVCPVVLVKAPPEPGALFKRDRKEVLHMTSREESLDAVTHALERGFLSFGTLTVKGRFEV